MTKCLEADAVVSERGPFQVAIGFETKRLWNSCLEATQKVQQGGRKTGWFEGTHVRLSVQSNYLPIIEMLLEH